MSGFVFDQLLPFSWKGVHFPVTQMRVSLSQSLAEHKVWKQDGANVEATGRDPLLFTAEIPFQNFIVPGPSEKWEGPLYPAVFRKFMSVAGVGTTGILIHPEFGSVKCKLRSADAKWDGAKRGGVDVDASWIETNDTDEAAADVLNNASPIQAAISAALDLDVSNQKFQLEPKGAYKESLSESLRKLTGIFDKVTVLSAQIGGQIAMVEYRVNAIKESMETARSAVNIQIIQNCHRVQSAIHSLRKNIVNDRRVSVYYRTPQIMTLAAISQATGDSVSDIMILNRHLMSSPAVPADTIVKYYADQRPKASAFNQSGA